MIKTTEEIYLPSHELVVKGYRLPNTKWITLEEIQKAFEKLLKGLGLDCSEEPKTKILVCIECQDKLTKLEGCEHYGIWLCQECYSKTFKPKGDDGK